MRRFAILSTLFLVLILTAFFVVSIWVPDLIDGEVVLKLFLTYVALLTGFAVVFRMAEMLKENKKPDDAET